MSTIRPVRALLGLLLGISATLLVVTPPVEAETATTTSTNVADAHGRIRLTISSTTDWATVTLEGATLLDRRVRSDQTTGPKLVASDHRTLALTGKGTLIIDAVVELPRGSSARLRTCKGGLGALDVVIRRLDDGAQVVSHRNTRSDGGGQAGCPNERAVTVQQTSLTVSTWPRRVDPRRLSLAFYYPWYQADSLSPKTFPSTPTSAWNTDDPAEVTKMVQAARGVGLDGFVVSYNGHPGLEPRVQSVFDAAAATTGFSVTTLVEVGHLSTTTTGGQVRADDLERLLRSALRRSSHRSWLRVGTRPVIFLYSHDLIGADTWQTVRARLRATGLNPFVMGQSADDAYAFDGLYQYSPNTAPRWQLRSWYSAWERAARYDGALDPGYRQLLWAAPVSPGQDDGMVLHRPLWERLFVDRDGGRYYDHTWATATRTRPEWTLVTSWNEWYEDTQISPSQEHGTTAMTQTRSWTTTFDGLS